MYRNNEGDMGVYGIAESGFFSCGISVILIFHVRYCGIISLCGMRFFIILADGIRRNKIVHGTVYLRLPFDTMRKTKHSRT